MDDIDSKLLEILKRDSRKSFVEIAGQLGVTEGTVRNRIKKLVQEGTIKKFTIKHKTGMEGLVLIKAKHTNLKGIIKELEKFSEDIYEISGDHDIVALITADSLDGLNKKVDKIRAIKGVASTSTAIKLTEA